MPNFFSDIQGYFSAEFSGRYFSIILRELAQAEPNSFAKILSFAAKKYGLPVLESIRREMSKGVLSAACEEYHQGTAGQRRSDLVLKSNGLPVAIFEIKEFDVHSPGNATQLLDYLALVKRRSIPFIHLSRFAPDADDRAQMKREHDQGHPVISLRYRDIYSALQTAQGPLARMVCDYLEDIGVTSYQTINLEEQERSVAFLIIRLLGFRHAHGKGRLASDQAISDLPRILQTLFGNLEFLGDVIKLENPKTIKTRFTRNLYPVAYFDTRSLSKALAKQQSSAESAPLPGSSGKFVSWGTVDFEASGKIHSPKQAKHKLGKDDWLYACVGYTFEATVGRDERLLSLYVYGGFRGRAIEDTYCTSQRFQKFPTEIQALRAIHDCLVRAKTKVKHNSDRAIKEALSNFSAPTRP